MIGRRPLIAFGGLLILATACGADAAASPSTPTDADDLHTYVEERHRALEDCARNSPDTVVAASATFVSPLAPAEVDRLIHDVDVELVYFEWRQVERALRGGDGWDNVGERAMEYVGLRVTHVRGEARAADWFAMAGDPQVWLVDLDGEWNLFDLAVEAGVLDAP